jgi:17beta-estradiol 17-dehydrogenase / very-long-chain 3-oxoacyl-CoA reductase
MDLVKFIVFLIFLKLFYKILDILKQYFFTKRKNLLQRYGVGTYVVITGPSRGQGKQFALQLASLGFNIILIGSQNTVPLLNHLKNKYENQDFIYIEKDFGKAFTDGFFDDISHVFQEKPVSMMINNVGYRSGWMIYQDMPIAEMKKSIAVGTIVQAVMTKFALREFHKRNQNKEFSAIVNITAQCVHSTDLFAFTPEISLPYLSVYEASNAFGFFHSNSVFQEVAPKYHYVDYLTITPGAVITEKTKDVLSDTIFSIPDYDYVSNILDLLGNYNGVRCAYFGHSVSDLLINVFPFMKTFVLRKVGNDIAKDFQKNKTKEYNE